MHLERGLLRAYLDHEIDEPKRQEIWAHLDTCTICRQVCNELEQTALEAQARLGVCAPGSKEEALPVHTAWAHLEKYIYKKENIPMIQKLFTRQSRPAWIALVLILALGISMMFPPVRAIANNFLGLFRVQQIQVVEISPGDFPEQLGSSQQLEAFIAENMVTEEYGDPQTVTSAEEASQLAGFPVRLPAEVEGALRLEVQPGGRMSFQVDLSQIQEVLGEIGRTDIQLPKELDGAQVSMELRSMVAASFGECDSPENPDSIDSIGTRCTTLIQMPSPEVSAPADLDLEQIGQAYLQILGMSAEDAASFSRNIDWTTTLVIPVPAYGAEYREVSVDGVTGTLLIPSSEYNQYALIWVKDGMVYALIGDGSAATALRIAGSIK